MFTVLAQGASISLMIAIMSVGLFGIHTQYLRRRQLTKTSLIFTGLMFASITSIVAMISISQTFYYHVSEQIGSTISNNYFMFAPLVVTCMLWLTAELYLKNRSRIALMAVSVAFIFASLVITSSYDKARVSPILIGLLFPGQEPADVWLYFLPVMLSSMTLSGFALRAYLRDRKRIDLLGAAYGPFTLVIPVLNTLVITGMTGTVTVSFLLLNLLNSLILVLFFVAKTDPDGRVADNPLLTFTKSIRPKMNITAALLLFLLLTSVSILTSLIFVKAYDDRSSSDTAQAAKSSADILQLNFQDMDRAARFIVPLASVSPEKLGDLSDDDQYSLFLTDDNGEALCEACEKWPYGKRPELGQTLDNFHEDSWFLVDTRRIFIPATGRSGILSVTKTLNPIGTGTDDRFSPTHGLIAADNRLISSSRPIDASRTPQILSSGGNADTNEFFYVKTTAPIVTADDRVVAYSFSFQTEDDRNRWTMLISLTMMEVGLILGMIAVSVVWYAIGRFIEPIIRLGKAAKKISGGDYDLRLKGAKKSGDELDVTIGAFNQMVKDIRSRTTDLEEKNREQRDFLNYVAHELKSPISAIQWTLELAEEEVKDESSLEYVSEAHSSAKRMRNLVNELLEFARLERDAIKMNTEPLSVENNLTSVMTELSGMAKTSGVTLERDVPDSLPQVNADPVRLNQVLTNVIGNAVKYTSESRGSSVKVSAHLTDDGKQLIISTRDQGIGIPVDQQHKIFGKFFRADNAVKNGIEGTGLGLHVSKRFIEMMGGRIWFESEPEEGSVFFVSLPVTRA